jgi:hypothetical protein
MINIILSPSQQRWNKCAIDGCNEQEHTHMIAKKIYDILQGYNCNVCLIPNVYGDELYTLNEVVRISNEFVAAHPDAEKSYHLEIHTDGGYAGTGSRAFYLSDAGKGFITQIWRRISRITPWGDGNVSKRYLYTLVHTTAVAGLLEISFHDKMEEAKWIHISMDMIADQIVRGMEETTGIVKINKPVVMPDVLNRDNVELVARYIGMNSPERWIKYQGITDRDLESLFEKFKEYIYAQLGV